MNPQQPTTQLDPKVKALASAIKRAETGGSADPYNTKGASGESGAYQYMPDTWKEWSREFLGNENAPMSVENQNKVAYERIRTWKDQGLTPAQIASKWNSGRENAYRENLKGVNDKGVSYDVPAYVEKVSNYYREIAGGVPQAQAAQPSIFPQNLQTTATAQPTQQQVVPQTEVAQPEKEPLSNRISDALGFGKTTETIGKLISRSPLAGLMQNEGQKRVENLTGMDQEQINEANIEGPTGKEIAGAALNVGSLALGGGGVVKAGAKLAGGKLSPALLAGAKSGGIAGGLAGTAQGLENNESAGGVLKNAAIGAGIGSLAGGAIPALGAVSGAVPGVTRVLTSTARKFKEGAEGAVEQQAKLRGMPKVEQEVVRSGLPENILNLKNTPPATQKSFSDMINIHKRGLSDPAYARTNMVKQVPARSFLEVVDGIQKQSIKAANELKRIAGSNPNERVDFSPAFQTYIESLSTKGIRINPKTGTFISDGRVPQSEMKYYDDILREIQAVVKDDPMLTRQQAHVLRQRLFATLDSATRQGGKPGQRPFSNDVDNDVQKFRGAIADLLGDEYKMAAGQYAKNERVLSEVAKIAGTTIDDINTKDRKLGEVFMRVLGNASDRPQSLIDDVLEAAERNGVPVNNDINAQIEFADLLERLYGSTQSRTMAQQVRTGVREAAEDTAAATSVMTGDITGAILAKGRSLMGKGQDDQIRAFEAFINELNKNKGLVPPKK